MQTDCHTFQLHIVHLSCLLPRIIIHISRTLHVIHLRHKSVYDVLSTFVAHYILSFSLIAYRASTRHQPSQLHFVYRVCYTRRISSFYPSSLRFISTIYYSHMPHITQYPDRTFRNSSRISSGSRTYCAPLADCSVSSHLPSDCLFSIYISYVVYISFIHHLSQNPFHVSCDFVSHIMHNILE